MSIDIKDMCTLRMIITRKLFLDNVICDLLRACGRKWKDASLRITARSSITKRDCNYETDDGAEKCLRRK